MNTLIYTQDTIIEWKHWMGGDNNALVKALRIKMRL